MMNSTLFPSRISPDIAREHIDGFTQRFGLPHLYLAYHAALPLSFTPDLLYSLWANFQHDINGKFLKIPRGQEHAAHNSAYG